MRRSYIFLFVVLIIIMSASTICAEVNYPKGKGGYGLKPDGNGGYEPDYGTKYTDYFYAGKADETFKKCTGSVDGDGCPYTPDKGKVEKKYYEKMSGKCGCPSTPQYKIDGCNITISCDLEDEDQTLVELKVPCPTVAGTDPKYPLVKMLSGTLIEWRVDGKYVSAPPVVAYRNTSTQQGYGTELFTDFNLDIVVSTVDTGAKWDLQKAKAIVAKTEKHSRDNIEFFMTGGNQYAKVMTAKDIYDAYKNRSDEVQAYLALAGKGWGERPWTTYDKFVEAMCKMSANPNKCKKALTGKETLQRVGNFYLGNGNPTILGVYSEISTHGCHGATVINDKGEPAFGFKFKSTFCIYMHATWGGYFYWATGKETARGECCVQWHEKHEEIGYNRDPESGSVLPIIKTTYVCDQWKTFYTCDDELIYEGPGESSEDCKQCIDIEGWIDPDGNMHTDALPISFYQSQPLLMRGAGS